MTKFLENDSGLYLEPFLLNRGLAPATWTGIRIEKEWKALWNAFFCLWTLLKIADDLRWFPELAKEDGEFLTL